MVPAVTCRNTHRIAKGSSMGMKLSRNTVLSLVSGACCLLWTCCALTAEPDPARQSAAAKALLKTLDPFYKQHVVADGLLIVGSAKVSRHALGEVGYLVRKMLANRPDVRKKFVERKMYVAVMAFNEMQTDLPECRGLEPWWDYRARGIAGGKTVSCGEENALGFRGDPWQGENIFIHEFAHGLHAVIGGIDERFNTRLGALYNKAKQGGRFRGYAIEGGIAEFWAEGVQAWFNCNGTIRPKSGGGQSSFEVIGPKGQHVCHITTREQVRKYLPDYAKLLDESFRRNEWTYVPVAKRLNEPHLRGYDPAKAPTFKWPAKVIAAFNEEQKAKKAKAEQARAKALSWVKVSPEQIAAAKKLGVPVAFQNSIGMRFVLIPSGTFMMGSKDSAADVARRCAMSNAQAGWFYDEHPRHKVALTKAFYMAIHEVTQGQYEAVTTPKGGKGPPKKKTDNFPDKIKGKNNPIGMVSLSDGENFCKKLSGSDGSKYALPTEAQWEYACRAGTVTPFSFGQTISTDQANYHGDYTYGKGQKGKHRDKPLPVGSMPPNAWGLHDMHGNVSELCGGRYGQYGPAAKTDPEGPAKGSKGILRGGSWRSYPGACRSAFRMSSGAHAYNIGFRVSCAVPTKSADGK